MPFVEIENFQLYYELYGTGKPLVLIPGFAAGSWLWFKQIKDLAESFQVIVFDPRGVSKSIGGSRTTVSVEVLAKDIFILLDELQIERASLLGTSFGGFVAQKFALNYRERLEKLILACTSFGGLNHVPPDLEVLMAFAATAGLNSSERIRKYMKPAFSEEFLRSFPEIAEQVCQLRETNEIAETTYLQQLQSATTFDAYREVSQISAETLIISGDEDKVVPLQNSLNLKSLIPNSKLEIIKKGGHLFFIEQFAEFNRIVKKFIGES